MRNLKFVLTFCIAVVVIIGVAWVRDRRARRRFAQMERDRLARLHADPPPPPIIKP